MIETGTTSTIDMINTTEHTTTGMIRTIGTIRMTETLAFNTTAKGQGRTADDSSTTPG